MPQTDNFDDDMKFGQNRSFLVKMVKIESFCIFWGPKLRDMSKFGESGQIIFSIEVSKNI